MRTAARLAIVWVLPVPGGPWITRCGSRRALSIITRCSSFAGNGNAALADCTTFGSARYVGETIIWNGSDTYPPFAKSSAMSRSSCRRNELSRLRSKSAGRAARPTRSSPGTAAGPRKSTPRVPNEARMAFTAAIASAKHWASCSSRSGAAASPRVARVMGSVQFNSRRGASAGTT